MNTTRIHRLLRIITLLQGQEGLTPSDLMVELSVSRRTLFRDLQLLQQAGIPCYFDSVKGYRISRSFFLPPVNLTVSETLGLMLLGKTAASQRQRPMMVPALSAIAKLTTTVPEPIRSVCMELMSCVNIKPGAVEYGDAENRYHTTLQRCADECRACRIKYSSPVEKTAREYLLHPYALHFDNRSWYVFAFSTEHQEVRTFKLSRIEELATTSERFTKPKHFSIEEKLGKAWQLIPEGKIYSIELEFSAKVARNVIEVRWHSTQQHHMLPDGRCRVNFEVDGLGEISWWICGYADQVRVISPRELSLRVKHMHEAAAKNMSENTSENPAPPEKKMPSSVMV